CCSWLSTSGLVRPNHPHEIPVFLESVFDLAVEGALDRLAYAARQVDIRRIDHEPLRVLFDADDPVERMFLLFCLLLMAGEVDHLLLVLAGEITSQSDDARGIFVVDAVARRAQRLDSTFCPRYPTPAPFVIARTALWADRALMQLLLALVG